MVKVPRLSNVVSRTPRWRWVLGLVVFVLAYVPLLLAYFNDGRSGAFAGHTDQDPPAGGVLVTLEFTGIDPVARVMIASVEVSIDDALQDPTSTAAISAPRAALTITVLPTADEAPLAYPAGVPMTVKEVRIPAEPGSGFIRDWPLDRYRSPVIVVDETGSGGQVPLDVSFGGAAQGWHVSAQAADPQAPAGSVGQVFDVEYRRSLGVVLFGVAILLVLIALPFLALGVVINVYRGRRKFEPAFLSWIAALLFATIPIRNFLPGSPPAGSWVDIAVVVWVVIALTAALCFGVGSWWRFSQSPDQPEPAAVRPEDRVPARACVDQPLPGEASLDQPQAANPPPGRG